MALIEATTEPGRHHLLKVLNDEVRKVAFAAANPLLAREVELLATDPRRIRKLSVETACEALNWIDDPELIASLANADSRSSVCAEAKSRLRKLQVSEIPKMSPNQDNIRLRTTKALERPLLEVPAALAELKDIDTEVFGNWFAALDAADMLAVLPRLAADIGTVYLIRPESRLVIERLNAAGVPDARLCLHELVNKSDTGLVYGLELLRNWPSPWGAPAAFLATKSAKTPPREVPALTDEALAVWRDVERFDLILWAGLASEEEIREAGTRTKSPEGALELLGLPNRAGDIDVLVAAMAEAGVLDTLGRVAQHAQARTFDRLLNMRGLSATTLEALLLAAPIMVQTNWLYGRYTNRPTKAQAELVAATFTPSDAARILQRRSGSPDELEALFWVFDVVTARPGGAFVVAQVAGYRGYGDDGVLGWVAARVQEAFGANEGAWSVFWTLLNSPGESSFDDLLASVQALA